MKIVRREDAPSLETVKGRRGVILQAGEKAMLMMLTVEPGIPTPPHSHLHEQMGYLLQGKGVLFSGGESVEIEAGTSFLISPYESHNFNATGDKSAVLIEAFSPPREDYLERVKKEGNALLKSQSRKRLQSAKLISPTLYVTTVKGLTYRARRGKRK